MPRTKSKQATATLERPKRTSPAKSAGTTKGRATAGSTARTAKKGTRTAAAVAATEAPVDAVDAAEPAVEEEEQLTAADEKLLEEETGLDAPLGETDVVDDEADDAPVEEEAEADTPILSGSTGAVPASRGRATRLRVPMQERPIEELWAEFKESGCDVIRNHLIEHYLDTVRFTAERMHARLPGEVDVDDLMSAGLFGLMDAIDSFDLERGVKFETFSARRIQGAIFDELRSMDWVPRLVRARTAKVEKARRHLEMDLGRKPTDDEISEYLGVDDEEFNKLSKDSKPVSTVSLNRKWFETDSSKDVREIDVIKDTRQENPLTEIQRKDLKVLITKGLSRAERLIVILYYYEGMTMKEIGITLDLSESRVSQMHSSILLRLKAQMQHREKDV